MFTNSRIVSLATCAALSAFVSPSGYAVDDDRGGSDVAATIPISICLFASDAHPCVPYVDEDGNGWGIATLAEGDTLPRLDIGDSFHVEGLYCTSCILPFCGSFSGFIFGAEIGECDDVIGRDIVGDVTGDGAVDAEDLAQLLGLWGAVCIVPCEEDLDGDGVIGALDLAVLLGAWTG